MKNINLEIKIESCNAAFQYSARGELYRILLDIANDIQNINEKKTIRDINGNNVGTLTLEIKED
jgi:hypothetical protein